MTSKGYKRYANFWINEDQRNGRTYLKLSIDLEALQTALTDPDFVQKSVSLYKGKKILAIYGNIFRHKDYASGSIDYRPSTEPSITPMPEPKKEQVEGDFDV